MFEDTNASIIQRGIDEALACQDMLARAPSRPSFLARLVARCERAVLAVISRRTEISPAGPRAARLELTR